MHREYTLSEQILEESIELQRESLRVQKLLLRELSAIRQQLTPSTLTGGTFRQIGSLMVPIQPGNTPVFQVTPTFSGAPFTTTAADAAVSSSDPTNFPVELVPSDATGLTFQAPIPTTATPTGGSEAITVTWTYTNTDGTTATVTGTVTELGIVDDVTGGTFAQIA
jgi:hypothetical protein